MPEFLELPGLFRDYFPGITRFGLLRLGIPLTPQMPSRLETTKNLWLPLRFDVSLSLNSLGIVQLVQYRNQNENLFWEI